MAKLRILKSMLPLTIMTNMVLAEPAATEPMPNVFRQKVAMATLQENPGYSLTAVIVELEPDTTIGPHSHSGFVFAYVLEGTVRSQLNDGVEIEYQAGDSWIEPSGTLHKLTRNPSQTKKAKFIAVFVAEANSTLTTPATLSD